MKVKTHRLSVEEVFQALTDIVGPDAAFYREEPLENAEYLQTAAITVKPDNEEEVSKIMEFAHENQLTVIPRGGGTKDAYGAEVKQADFILSLERMKGIIEHSAGDLIMTVLPGTTLAEIQTYLAHSGQFLPLDSNWPNESTIGGLLAANDSGPMRAMYGSARDLLVATRMVYPDGTILRTGQKVVKNVAGYDMNKLFIGSMGTLAVFTELTFRLRPLPAYESLILLTSETVQPLIALQGQLLDSTLEPSALELLSPTIVQSIITPGGKADYGMAIAFEDVDKSVHYQIEQVVKMSQELGIEHVNTLFQAAAKDWWASYKAQVLPSGRINADNLQISLKTASLLTQVGEIVEWVHQQSEASGVKALVFGGGYTGVGSIHLLASSSEENNLIDLSQRIQRELEERGAQTVVYLAPNRLKPDLLVWGKEKPYVKLLKGIKEKIDPGWILNPGRYVGGI